MNNENIKKIVEDLVVTFLYAGQVALDLRDKGLRKKMKFDNTPVSNGDIEVNEILTNKINIVSKRLQGVLALSYW